MWLPDSGIPVYVPGLEACAHSCATPQPIQMSHVLRLPKPILQESARGEGFVIKWGRGGGLSFPLFASLQAAARHCERAAELCHQQHQRTVPVLHQLLGLVCALCGSTSEPARALAAQIGRVTPPSSDTGLGGPIAPGPHDPPPPRAATLQQQQQQLAARQQSLEDELCRLRVRLEHQQRSRKGPSPHVEGPVTPMPALRPALTPEPLRGRPTPAEAGGWTPRMGPEPGPSSPPTPALVRGRDAGREGLQPRGLSPRRSDSPGSALRSCRSPPRSPRSPRSFHSARSARTEGQAEAVPVTPSTTAAARATRGHCARGDTHHRASGVAAAPPAQPRVQSGGGPVRRTSVPMTPQSRSAQDGAILPPSEGSPRMLHFTDTLTGTEICTLIASPLGGRRRRGSAGFVVET